MNFVNGSRLAIYPGEGLTGFWYVEIPDFEELSFLSRRLWPGCVFYDVGANAGAYSVFAAARGCRVYAFEPVPHTFRRLEENAELNRPGLSINCVNRALGSSSRSLRMTFELGPGNRIITSDDSAPSVEVSCTTLDAFTEEHEAPDFIKIDVEGHELEVLRGARKTLATPSLKGLLVETFRPSNWHLPQHQELERLLASHGFVPCNEDSSGIREMTRPEEGTNNTLYLRVAHFQSVYTNLS